MKLKKNFRVAALFLVIITMFVAMPITTKAAVKSDIPYPMRKNFVLDALQYLEYDVNKLKNDGYLYQEGYYGGDLIDEKNSSKRAYGLNILSNIAYDDSGSISGLNTKNGKPDIEYFESYGLNCASFVTYVYLNYLPNVAKKSDGSSYKDDATYKYIKKAMEHWTQVNGWSYQADDTWREAFNEYANNKEIRKYTASYSNISQMESKSNNKGISQIQALNLEGKLKPGDLICLGRLNNNGSVKDWVHVAIYLGTYNGEDFVAHCTGGVAGQRRENGGGRGPEISTLSEIYTRKADDKFSYPIEFYHIYWPYDFGTIQINKTGENGAKLAGAQFKVTKDDGTVSQTIVTDKNGFAKTRELPLGTYTVTETVFPEGFGTGTMQVVKGGAAISSSNSIIVTIGSNNTEIVINAVNKENIGTIYGFKCRDDGVNPLRQISGAKIGIFKKSEIDEYKKKYPSATHEQIYRDVRAVDTCISGEVTTTPSGETGKVGLYIFENLKYDTYIIAEMKAPTGYQLTTSTRTVKLESKLKMVGEAEGGAIRNYPITGSVKGYKVNEKNEGINGVVFGLFNADTTEFTEKNAYRTCTTYANKNINGYFEFKNVPYGKYLLAEIVPPTGHFYSNRKYSVDISKHNEVIDVGKIINHTIKANLGGYKTDEQGMPLEGVVFGLFDNVSKTLESEAIDICTTDRNGYFEFKNVPLGIYYVREIYPISGYEKTESFYIARVAQTSKDTCLVNMVFRPNGLSEGAFEKKYLCCYEETKDGKYEIIYRHYLYDESKQEYVKGKEIEDLKSVFGAFIFKNIPKPVSVSVEKYDDKGTVLKGATFLLEWSEDGENWKTVTFTNEYTAVNGETTSNVEKGELTTNDSGKVVFEGLTPNLYYRLTETKAPEGYSILKDSVFEGLIGKTEDLTFTVVNNPIFKLPPTGGNANFYIPVSIIAAGIFLCVSILMIKKQVKKG